MSTAITPGEVVAVGRRDVGFLGRVGGDGCGGGCDIVPGLVYGWRRRRGSARWSRTVRCSGRRTGCGQRLPRPRSSSGCQAGTRMRCSARSTPRPGAGRRIRDLLDPDADGDPRRDHPLYAQPGVLPEPALEQLTAKARELDMDEVWASVAERGGSVPSGSLPDSPAGNRPGFSCDAVLPGLEHEDGGYGHRSESGPAAASRPRVAGHSLYPHGYSEPMRREVARWRIIGGCPPQQRGLA